MALKDLLDGGKCLLGFHQGEWRLMAPDRCVFAQTCERCDLMTTRTDHVWGAWAYASEGACEQRRVCGRCPEHETRVVHAWGVWAYLEQHRAPVRTCARCRIRVSAFVEEPLPVAGSTTGPAPATVAAAAPADDGRPPAAGVNHDGDSDHDTDSDDDDSLIGQSDWTAAIAGLRADFEQRVASGEIPPDRQPHLRAIMAQFEQSALRGASGDLDEQRIGMAQTQQLMQQMGSLLMHPSRGGVSSTPAAGSRHAALTAHLEQLYRYVTGEVSRLQLTSDEGQAAGRLLASLKGCRDGLHAAAGDDDPVGLEAQSLRQAAMDIRTFSLRQHLTAIHPLWPSQRIPQNANAVFYAGGSEVGGLVRRVCETKRLAPLVLMPHREPASLRWDQLRECAIAVFDFTGYRRTAAVEDAAPVAAVAYELGIALTLGRPVLLVAHENQPLPFDLDIEPVRLAPGTEDAAAVAAGLDLVLYGLQRGTAGESVSRTARYLKARYANHGDFHVRISLDSLTDETVGDPIRTAFLMSSSLMFIGTDAPSLVYPPWPGDYPDPASPLCFHVTPFGPDWAANTRFVVSERCSELGVEYARGDLRPEQDIMKSIWNDLCRATHVVVDLTGLNANVALELGMAHTLGRKVRLITQDEHPERSFKAIAKQRLHRYALPTNSGPGLTSQLSDFLN
jgi:hypothetical protein